MPSTPEQVQLLQTIPGVGRRTAEVIVTALDDPYRFQNARQVSAGSRTIFNQLFGSHQL